MGEAGVTLGHAMPPAAFGQAVEFWHGRPLARLAWSGALGPEGASIGVCIGVCIGFVWLWRAGLLHSLVGGSGRDHGCVNPGCAWRMAFGGCADAGMRSMA